MIDITPLRILQVHGKVSKDEFIKSCWNVNQKFYSLIDYDLQIGNLIQKLDVHPDQNRATGVGNVRLIASIGAIISPLTKIK